MHDLLADMATGTRGKFGTQGMPVIERGPVVRAGQWLPAVAPIEGSRDLRAAGDNPIRKRIVMITRSDTIHQSPVVNPQRARSTELPSHPPMHSADGASRRAGSRCHRFPGTCHHPPFG